MTNLYKKMFSLRCLVLLCFFMTQFTANAQIVKVLLDGNNDCSGKLYVGLYVRASQFSPMDFKIGSSSIFLNFDPTVVSFLDYTPEEFHNTGPADARWLDQKASADNECGLSSIVLQLMDNSAQNIALTTQSAIHIGTVEFDMLMEAADPSILLNQRFTYFNNAVPNNGTELVILEDYPKLMDYSCASACASSPVVNVIQVNPADCNTATGSIELDFTNNSGRSFIAFSIDGGLTYPYFVDLSNGSTILTDLSSGIYNVWARWGNEECPTKISDVNITNAETPEANFQAYSSCDINSAGLIRFSFPDHPTRTTIQFSLDDGVTFPYAVADNSSSFDVTDLPIGNYAIWTRWGDGSCTTSLGSASIDAENYPIITVLDLDICGDQTAGILKFTFEDHPQYSEIEISLDGGQTFTYAVNDAQGRYDIDDLALGTYEVWAKWQNFSCGQFIKTVAITTDLTPAASLSATGTCSPQNLGDIRFDFQKLTGRATIAFSIDGGNSYEMVSYVTETSYTFTNLASGIYHAKMKWGNDECPVDLGVITVQETCSTCQDGIKNGTEEYIDCGGSSCIPCDMCPYSTVTISDRPIADQLSFLTSDWLRSDGLISSSGNVSLKATNHIELMSGFEVLTGGQLLIAIEGCMNN